MRQLQSKPSGRLKLRIKKGLIIAMAILVLVVPDLLWEHTRHLLHVLFESLSFILEEILMHGFGFTKHHAQMIVFYSFMFSLLAGMWFLWRRLPFLLETLRVYIQALLLGLRSQAIHTWRVMSAMQKIQVLIANLIGLGLTSLFL